ncbi:MAG: helix-turn-helix domain-containing protein [Marinomonas sp.]
MSYKQLIEGQRYQIKAYLSQHLSYREIGRRLNISHSSISRELKRHTINGTYEPNVAQHSAVLNIDNTVLRKARYHRKPLIMLNLAYR